ncbi:hypothetical protein [Pseudoalteromonas ruthenica]|uniref:hypothetical protein n=1 Tax=Pseudoalteromonas ruthenica TaxID=151081 RepID=UPI0003B3609E|nr:hypothetical protein [Pseudoalteromonas ruthenica]
MKTCIIMLFVVLLASCSTTSGQAPEVSSSGFDDSKVVTISPHGNASSTIIGTGLGAQWTSATPEKALLIVAIFNDIQAISDAELMVDGSKITLTPSKGVTDFESSSYGIKKSTRAFSTNLDTIKRITEAKKAWIRVHTPTGYMEDPIIDGPTDSKAFHALKRFIKSVEE